MDLYVVSMVMSLPRPAMIRDLRRPFSHTRFVNVNRCLLVDASQVSIVKHTLIAVQTDTTIAAFPSEGIQLVGDRAVEAFVGDADDGACLDADAAELWLVGSVTQCTAAAVLGRCVGALSWREGA